jgi:uncharacterized protein YuzE
MRGPISISVDTGANAAYIELGDAEVARTVAVTDSVNVDLDDLGVAVGIEVLGLHTVIPWARLVRQCHVHSEVVDTVRLIKPDVGGFLFAVAHRPAGVQEFNPRHATEVATA